tara:strand:- start:467 stop:709 length:243 start_codon:yes stop_codon:yes gene_type:complete
MEIKIINNQRYDFEPIIISYQNDGDTVGAELVGEIVYSQREFDSVTDWLEKQDREYVAGPLSKTIALTNIASLKDLRKLV